MPLRGGLPEVPCAKCGQRVRGLAWAALCADCTAERNRRASRLSQRIAILATLAAAAYVWFRIPADPTARYYGAIAVVATYILVRRIVQRIAMEVMT